MRKNIKTLLTFILTLSLMVSLVPATAFAAGGVTFYVSPQGSDTASGTSTAPWKTLNYAVSQMNDGDTLILKDGVYREELKVSGKSSLTFRAENKGGAVISACDLVSGWTLDSDNIWKTTVTTAADIYNGDGNIVFANGILCQEARWPDLTEEGKDGGHPLLNLDNYARVENGSSSGSVPTIVDASLSELSDFEDAYVWTPGGVAYWSYISPIESYDSASNTLTLVKEHFSGGTGYYPKKTGEGYNIYYLFGSKSLLSTEGEWYREGDTLYMYHEGDTAPANVEFRVREYTMRVDSADYITIDGISFRGGIPAFGKDTEYCTITNCLFETVDYYMPRVDKNIEGDWQSSARGVILNGTYNKVINSEFANLYGEGLLLLGNDNKVLNNYFHDFNFEATYADGVQVKTGLSKHTALVDWDKLSQATAKSNIYGNRHLISHNTFTHSGRSAIGGSFRKTVISYNDISDGGILTRDGGVVYLAFFDFDVSEFHHNILRDSLNGEGMQYGFYMDSFCTGLNVYRNLIYGQQRDDNMYSLTFVTSKHNIGNFFANNTFINRPDALGSTPTDHSQTVFVNNLFAGPYAYKDTYKLGSEVDYNIEKFTDFTDAANHDYTLVSTAAAAIDKAKHIPGITDGYVGDAPDVGAFEYGTDSWEEKVGHDFSNTAYVNEKYSLNTRIPYGNKVKNSGFEYFTNVTNQGTIFEGWTSDSPVTNIKRSAWNSMKGGMYTKNGSYAAGIRKGQTLTQTVTGLKPNTVYEIGGYATSVGTTWDSWINDYPVVGSAARYSEGRVSGFVSGDTEDWFCYAPLTFDDDTDTIRFDVSVGKSSKANETRKIEIYTAGNKKLDQSVKKNYDSGADISSATLLGSVNIDPTLSKSAEYDIIFSQPISGDHKIYFKFVGDFYGVAFLPSTSLSMFNSVATDRAVIRATSDTGETKEIEFTEIAGIPDTMKQISVITGESGSVKIDLTKTEGSMVAYFDEVRLRESFAQNAYDTNRLVVDYDAYDEKGELLCSVKKNQNHTIKGTIEDINGLGGEVKLALSAMYKDGTVFETKEQNTVIPAEGTLDFELTVKTPLSEDCYLILTVENDSIATYAISDYTLNESYKGNDIFVDDVSVHVIRDGVPVLSSELSKGEFNMLGISLRNRAKEDVDFTGILAIYDGQRLVDVMDIRSVIDADGEDNFWLGKVLPDSENLAVKLFTWENTETLKPIVAHNLFD